jgi:CMP-2-keto-3-deoxyoctulosonic acid synthetase
MQSWKHPKMEQLRYLEFENELKWSKRHVGIGIDTPEDLEKREKLYYSRFS